MKRLILALALIWGPAHATHSFYIEAASGLTHFYQYKKDGARWYQDAFPWSAELNSSNFRLGIGQRINADWDLVVSWLDIGRNSVDALAVPDDAYDAVNHQCISNCDRPTRLIANGHGYGPEIAWKLKSDSFYLRGGIFAWIVNLKATMLHQDGTYIGSYKQPREVMLAPFLGVGYKHKDIFFEVSYYSGIGSGGYPISTKALVSMIGIQVNLD